MRPVRVRTCPPPLASLLLIVAGGFGASVAQEVGAPSDLPPGALLPDLRVLPPSDLHIVDDRDGGGSLRLKFATVIWNAGAGPIEVHGPAPQEDGEADAHDGGASDANAEGTADREADGAADGAADRAADRASDRAEVRPDVDAFAARQIVYDADGGRHDLGEVGVLNYEHRHGHLHLASFARYELWRLEDGAAVTRVAENDKVGFCLMDNLLIDEDRAERDDPWYVACDRTVQGISPGWGDIYVAELFEQDLVLDGVTDGRYRLIQIADPDDALYGADPAVAWASLDLVLKGATVRGVAGSERTGGDATTP